MVLLLNQDREKLVGYENTDTLHATLSIKDNIVHGINLMLHNQLLGTFDNVGEVTREMTNIKNCEYSFYVVNGFENWKG